jgi:hypothetical protein
MVMTRNKFRLSKNSKNFSKEEFREIYDIVANRDLICASIGRYGYAPEHNIYDYEYALDDDTRNVFINFQDEMGILAKQEPKSGIWWILAEPLAPLERRAGIIVAFLLAVFATRGARAVRFELRADTRKALIGALPKDFRARAPSVMLTTPLFELERFDPELKGNFYKKIRSVVNQYYKAHRVEVLDAAVCAKTDVHNLVAQWRKNRIARDRAFDKYYHNIIDNDFRGLDAARVLYADGKAVALNGGWHIPNSHNFYKALGIHDYSDRALGDVMMVEELSWLKRAGFALADFGGGEKHLTNFKKRFGPASYYKSYEFTIVRDKP